MVRVIAAGHVNWDVTLRVDRLPEPDSEASIRSERHSGGGSAANAAATLAALGVDVGLIGSVGRDEHGRAARRELRESGVDLSNLRIVEDATTLKYLIVAEDGRVFVLGKTGANEAVRPRDVDRAYVSDADHVHLTSQRPETAALLARAASDAGATVSFDPGRRLGDRDFSVALARSDLLFLNDREATAILDPDSLPPAVGETCTVVTKHGGDGATVVDPSGSCCHPGFGVDPVDTTGAGDAFAAGFIAVLLDGGDYATALEFANACGALASLRIGARCMPTRTEVAAFLDARC